jgi:epoxyqueuosine reductase
MTAVAPTGLEERVRKHARELGFDPVGFTTLGSPATFAAFSQWIAAGYAGEMAYLQRGAAKRADTRLPVEGARSAIVVGLDYGGRQPAGPVARYARGDDYHDIMSERLDALHRWLEGEVGRAIVGKAYVDTGPILERDLAQRAGLGWIGKNTMLINPKQGSFFFLGALLVDLHLVPDPPFESDRCGTCTRCLDACPTGAFVAPRTLDARRCISYLTIEHRSEIAPELRAMIGNHLYGCDVCQDVCPWNVSFARELSEPAFQPRAAVSGKDAATLAHELMAMDEESFREAYRGSPMKRARHAGLLRNARIVADQLGSDDSSAAGNGSADASGLHSGTGLAG